MKEKNVMEDVERVYTSQPTSSTKDCKRILLLFYWDCTYRWQRCFDKKINTFANVIFIIKQCKHTITNRFHWQSVANRLEMQWITRSLLGKYFMIGKVTIMLRLDNNILIGSITKTLSWLELFCNICWSEFMFD